MLSERPLTGLQSSAMPKRSKLLLWIDRRRSPLLMWSLIALFLASPLADLNPLIGAAIDLLAVVVILTRARYSGNPYYIRNVVLPLSALWLLARAADAIADIRHVDLQLAPIAGLALCSAILRGLLRRFGAASRVTSAIISEALISYLVIAIAFAQLYRIIDHSVPNMFRPPISASDSAGMLYFSMITLSGVGYGDIVPINRFVRIVAGLESITGIFYIAVVVARLVASYTPRPPRERGIGQPDKPARDCDQTTIDRL
jgi:hypothetical protein